MADPWSNGAADSAGGAAALAPLPAAANLHQRSPVGAAGAAGSGGARAAGVRRAVLSAGARAPASLRDRVANQFRSRQNVAYLQGVVKQRLAARPDVPAPLKDYAAGRGIAATVADFAPAAPWLYSDPLARRGGKFAVGFWGEVQRLNEAFLGYWGKHVEAEKNQARWRRLDSNPPRLSEAAAILAADEPYHMVAFAADSLAPPGLADANRPTLYEFGSHAYSLGGEAFAAGRRERAAPNPAYDPADWGWDRGDAHASAAQTVAEYYGEGAVASAPPAGGSALRRREFATPADDPHSPGVGLGPPRFERYREIPRWQRPSRIQPGIDTDNEDSYGMAPRQLDSQHRRWHTLAQ